MKHVEVKLVPLSEDDREQFILDNQWAFKHGTLYEFGERDNHIDADGGQRYGEPARRILIKETSISTLTNVAF